MTNNVYIIKAIVQLKFQDSWFKEQNIAKQKQHTTNIFFLCWNMDSKGFYEYVPIGKFTEKKDKILKCPGRHIAEEMLRGDYKFLRDSLDNYLIKHLDNYLIKHMYTDNAIIEDIEFNIDNLEEYRNVTVLKPSHKPEGTLNRYDWDTKACEELTTLPHMPFLSFPELTTLPHMPFLSFPSDWEIQVLPNFGGVYARFIVKRKHEEKNRVSVYLDTKGAAGRCWNDKGESVPYLEAYNIDFDCPEDEFQDVDRCDMDGDLFTIIESQLNRPTAEGYKIK